MKLSQKAISEFREIYKRKFGTDLNEGEAQEKAIDLLRFFKLMCKPVEQNKKSIQSSFESCSDLCLSH